MGTDTKRISPDHIKGVEASFKVADSHLAEKSSDLIESDATEKLSAATSSVKQIISCFYTSSNTCKSNPFFIISVFGKEI